MPAALVRGEAARLNVRKAGETVEEKIKGRRDGGPLQPRLAAYRRFLESSHGRTGEAEAEQRERGGFGNRCGLHQIQGYVVDVVKRSVGVCGTRPSHQDANLMGPDERNVGGLDART